MRVLLPVLFCTCVLTAGVARPAHAQNKSLPVNLVDCSIVFELNRGLAAHKGESEKVLATYDKAVARFKQAAVHYAKKEGRQDPTTFLKAVYDQHVPLWHEKFMAIAQPRSVTLSMQAEKEVKAWTNYCTTLGRKVGILPIR